MHSRKTIVRRIAVLALSGLLFPSVMAQAMGGGSNHMNGSGQSHAMTNIENMTMDNTQGSTFNGHAVDDHAGNVGINHSHNNIRQSDNHNYSQHKGGASGLSQTQTQSPPLIQPDGGADFHNEEMNEERH